MRLVGTGQGITILPAMAVETLNREQKQHVFPFKAPAPVREVSLATHRDFMKSDLITALKAEIMETIPKEFVDGKEVQRVPPTPRLNKAVSQKANSGIWQLAQLMVLSSDKIGSENNFSPKTSGLRVFGFSNPSNNTDKKIKAAILMVQK